MQIYIASDQELPSLDVVGVPVRSIGRHAAWRVGYAHFAELFDGCACCLIADDPSDIDFESRAVFASVLRRCVDAGCRIELCAQWGEDRQPPMRMADLVPEDLLGPEPTFSESFDRPLLFRVRTARGLASSPD